MAIKPSTLVQVKRDNKEKRIPINELQIGDHILSDTNRPTYKKVIDVYSYKVNKDQQRHIEFDNGVTISCSDNQFVLCDDDGKNDVEVDELTENHKVLSETNTVNVRKVLCHGKKRSKYVDVFVEDSGCYYCSNTYNGDMILMHS